MTDTSQTQVLIAGGGPVGLTTAVRPDGYLSLAGARLDHEQLKAHLGTTFAPLGGGEAR